MTVSRSCRLLDCPQWTSSSEAGRDETGDWLQAHRDLSTTSASHTSQLRLGYNLTDFLTLTIRENHRYQDWSRAGWSFWRWYFLYYFFITNKMRDHLSSWSPAHINTYSATKVRVAALLIFVATKQELKAQYYCFVYSSVFCYVIFIII